MATPQPRDSVMPPPPPMRATATAGSAPAPVFPAPAKQIAQAASPSTYAAATASTAEVAASPPKQSALAPPTDAPTSTSTSRSSSQEPPPSLDDALLPDGSLDMRALMIALWRNRRNAAFTAELCARLPRLSISPATLDQVEFYLPQLAHMVVHLEKELPMEAMEQFVLLLSQTSVHFALQFFWIIFAALDENRPKRGGNPRTFARCAQLLLALEQCFVYGSPAAREASELLTRNSISRDEMDQIVMADRRFFAAQSSLEICYEGACISSSGGADKVAGGASSGGAALNTSSGGAAATAAGGGSGGGGGVSVGDGGWLFKKGGGTSKMGRRNWTLRWCRVENRILLVFTRPSDANPRTAFPLVRAEIRVVENKRHPFYFELVHELSETRMQFAAQSQEELVTWIAVLQKQAAAPEPPVAGASTSPGKVSTGRTLARMSLAMRSFILASSSGAPVAVTSSPTSASAPATETPDANEVSSSSPARTESSSFRSASSSLAIQSTGSPASKERAQTASSLSTNARSLAETGEASRSASQSECFQLQALATSALLPEQQLRYEFFTGMINFVKAVTDVSESLRRVEPPKRKPLLRPRLEALRVPPLAYIPLCKSTDTYCNVTSVLAGEGRVFSTNERAPCMIYFETEENVNGDDVSKALFTQLYAGTSDGDSETGGEDTSDCGVEGDDAEDVTTIDSSDEILKYLEDSSPKSKATQPPKLVTSISASEEEPKTLRPSAGQESSAFLHQLLASPERKQKLEKIFGELTVSAVKRLRPQTGDASRSRWRLCCLMAKSYDDLRQEVLVMQLISYFQHIFRTENLSLWLQPYRILSTGASTGLLEVVRNTTSLDGIKKTPGFKNLRAHFQDVYGSGSGGGRDDDDDDGGELLRQAELNFIHSLAGYSLVCYILAIKDRHNGNILIDVEGHIVHIDFGFFLGRAPGGSFSFETAPFKLTTEMVDVLGGRQSSNFQYFSDLCVQGALAIRKHAETIYTLVEVMSLHSRLPCFLSSVATPLAGLRERLFLNVAEEKVAPLIRSMIERSYDHFGTNKYDQFQVFSNGIAK